MAFFGVPEKDKVVTEPSSYFVEFKTGNILVENVTSVKSHEGMVYFMREREGRDSLLVKAIPVVNVHSFYEVES